MCIYVAHWNIFMVNKRDLQQKNIYMSSVVNIGEKAIKEINNIIQNFMLDNSTSKIAQKILIQKIENGGLKLCHFETKVKSLQLSWTKHLIDEMESTWKILPKLFYSCTDLNKCFSTNIYKPNNVNIPTFYLQIHKKIFKYLKK